MDKQLKPSDFCINWSRIGSSIRRLSLLGWALADLAREAIENGEFEEPEVIAGVEASGVPLGLIVAEELERPFTVVRSRPHIQRAMGSLKGRFHGAISVSFASVEKKRVLIVEDVISSGETLSKIVKALKEAKAKPVGIIVFINKRAQDTIEEVPIRALVKVVPME